MKNRNEAIEQALRNCIHVMQSMLDNGEWYEPRNKILEAHDALEMPKDVEPVDALIAELRSTPTSCDGDDENERFLRVGEIEAILAKYESKP